MAPCPLCSQPILTYRIRLTSDDELSMCCNENCMYPFHDKDTFRSSLVVQKSAKMTKKRKQDALETDVTQELMKAAKTTQPPKLTPPTNKDLAPRHMTKTATSVLAAPSHFIPALPNTCSKTSHVAVPPTKSNTTASTIYPFLYENVTTTSSASDDPLAFLESVPINPMPKAANPSSLSSLSSPTALPPLSAASSPDMSLDFLDSDPWVMPTTPPSMIQTMNRPKHPDVSSSMTDQSIRDLLFDDFDADPAQMPDFGSLVLDLDDTSLDALLGGLPSV